jgi:hypothetical protein
MKMIKSRKSCKCYSCKNEISKGDLYAKKSIRLGSSAPDTVENINGVASIVSHGITVSTKYCAACA